MFRQGTVNVLGIPVSTLSMAQTIARIGEWIAERKGRYVCVADVYNIVESTENLSHRASLLQAAMVTPDGTPLVWTGRLKGARHMQRVCGPDLMPALCAHSAQTGWKHYFYGGANGVASLLADTLVQRFPGLTVVGAESPPFRPLTPGERAEMLGRLEASQADIVWIGLGCPKQEAWMRDHVADINCVLIGVGAAFDFHTGRVARAPLWMRNNGLEWLYRLVSEPKRLWKRYLIAGPRFIAMAGVDVLRDYPRRRAAGRASAADVDGR